MPRTARRKQILIIDPDTPSATRLRATIDGLGYRGLAVKPTDAMTLARGLRLYLAVLDDAIPPDDLAHLATQLHRAAVPVVVLYTPSPPAAGEPSSPPPSIAGATAYLAKPWRTTDIVQMLYRFLGAPA